MRAITSIPTSPRTSVSLSTSSTLNPYTKISARPPAVKSRMSSPCFSACVPGQTTSNASPTIGTLSSPSTFNPVVCPQYAQRSPLLIEPSESRAATGTSSSRIFMGSSQASPTINKKRTSPARSHPSPAGIHQDRASSPSAVEPASTSTVTSDTLSPTVPAVAQQKKQRPLEPAVKRLPQAYQLCAPTDLVILISDMLSELVGLNDRIPLSGAGLTRFHSRAPPTISIGDYLNRLTVHATLQPSILLAMVYYIDVLSTHYPPFVVSSLTVHRFLITAATVASKGLCDTFLTNGYYAKVGGVSIMELNMLELEFLVRVGWRIVPKNDVLGEYYKSLVGRLAERYQLEDERG